MKFLLIFTIICSFAIIQQINAQECQGLNSNCDDGFLSQNCCSGLECIVGRCQLGFLPEWAKCGGKDFQTDLQCHQLLTCVEDSEWYSQCQFLECKTRYSQCGGLGYKGNKVCCPGLECVFQGEYWSSCVLVLVNEQVQEEKNGDEETIDESVVGDSENEEETEENTDYYTEDTNTDNTGETTENSGEETENSMENTNYSTEDTNTETTNEDADQTYYSDDETLSDSEDAITDESGN